MTIGAEEEADAEAGPAPARPMSTTFFLAILAALTLAAGGAGFFGGLQILATAEQALRSGGSEAAGPAGGGSAESANLKVLTPIVTNLAGSPPVWIRLEGTLLFRDEIPPDADALATRITEDIVAFLRTTSVDRIEGATGFQHLSEDLNDRVRVRSEGRVRELIIQGLIIE
jgi:flagellar FliL protein